MTDNFKTFRHRCYIVNMAHPYSFVFTKTFEQWRLCIHFYRSFTKFTSISRFNFTAQSVSHELHAVAKAEHRRAQFEYFCFNTRRFFFVYAVRTACENYTHWVQFFDFSNRFIIRIHFTVNVVFTNATCNQLIILTAKIDNDNKLFLVHHALH